MSDTCYRLITCNYSFDTHSYAGFVAFETACHYFYSNSEHNYPRGFDELTLVALVHSALRQSRNLRLCGSSRRLSFTNNNMVFPVWASSSFRFMVCRVRITKTALLPPSGSECDSTWIHFTNPFPQKRKDYRGYSCCMININKTKHKITIRLRSK